MMAPSSERLDWWSATVDKFSGIQTISPTADFRSRMIRRSLGDFKLFWIKCESPHRAFRRIDNSDYCFVNIQLGSGPVIFRGNNEFTVTPGGMAVYTARKGFEIDFPGSSESLVLAAPYESLSLMITDLRSHLGDIQSYDPNLVGLLANSLMYLFTIDNFDDSYTKECLAGALINQLSAVLGHLGSEADLQTTWSRQATLQRVKAYILDHITDSDLCPASIAGGTGLATSYLHKLFRNDRYHLMEFVKVQRLERCRSEITKDRSGKSLSQIAFDWGFNDASHFTRSFRHRFGMSPRQYRDEARKRSDAFTRCFS